MIFNTYTSNGIKNLLLKKKAQRCLFAEHRMLCREQRNPEAPTDGAEDAEDGTETKKGGESIEKTKADTSEGVHRIAGKEMNEQKPLDIRPDVPVQKPSVYRHLQAARSNAPTIGEAGKAALTSATILVPPAALAVAAGIGVRNLWQRFRGVPKEQRVGLTGSVGEGIRSLGKTIASPFRAATNVAKFGLDVTGRTLNTVVGGPIRGIGKLLRYKGKEGNEKHLFRELLKGAGNALYQTLSLTWRVPMGIVKAIGKIADDAWEKPIRTAIGAMIIGAGGAALIYNPAAVGAAAIAIGEGVANLIGAIPSALKLMMNIPSIPSIPGVTP